MSAEKEARAKLTLDGFEYIIFSSYLIILLFLTVLVIIHPWLSNTWLWVFLAKGSYKNRFGRMKSVVRFFFIIQTFFMVKFKLITQKINERHHKLVSRYGIFLS